jgi:urease accessory protein UreF
MNFEEWLNKEMNTNLILSDQQRMLEKAWNAAVDESIGAAWNADDGGDESGGAALSRAEENMEKLKS